MPTLNLPAFAPVIGGPGNDGRRRSLAYTCQRISDGQWLNAQARSWAQAPVLNSLSERGRTSSGVADPATGVLRGSYVGQAVVFDTEEDTLGQFQILYHDRSRDNVVVGSTLFYNGMQIRGKVELFA